MKHGSEMPEKRSRYNFPDVTLGELRTELNRRVEVEGNHELDGLRNRVARATQGVDGGRGLSLTNAEHARVTTILSDNRDDAEDRAERMDANIFGNTDEQAERSRSALRGVYSDPHGRDIVSAGPYDIPEEDFERATRRHGERPQAARVRDEASNARLTTDYDRWASNPGAWDYPGVDTVGDPEVTEEDREQAREAYMDRSYRARMTDRATLAPVTTDADVYAAAPHRWDFPDLDTPPEYADEYF